MGEGQEGNTDGSEPRPIGRLQSAVRGTAWEAHLGRLRRVADRRGGQTVQPTILLSSPRSIGTPDRVPMSRFAREPCYSVRPVL
jgi:hypothetical protein